MTVLHNITLGIEQRDTTLSNSTHIFLSCVCGCRVYIRTIEEKLINNNFTAERNFVRSSPVHTYDFSAQCASSLTDRGMCYYDYYECVVRVYARCVEHWLTTSVWQWLCTLEMTRERGRGRTNSLWTGEFRQILQRNAFLLCNVATLRCFSFVQMIKCGIYSLSLRAWRDGMGKFSCNIAENEFFCCLKMVGEKTLEFGAKRNLPKKEFPLEMIDRRYENEVE